jgi:hypothetical protein
MVISLRLGNELGARVKELAESEHRSMNSFIVMCIWNALDPQPKPMDGQIVGYGSGPAMETPVTGRPRHAESCRCYICKPPKEDGLKVGRERS